MHTYYIRLDVLRLPEAGLPEVRRRLDDLGLADLFNLNVCLI